VLDLGKKYKWYSNGFFSSKVNEVYSFNFLFSLVAQLLLFSSLIPFLINKIEIGREKRIFVVFIAFSTVMEILGDSLAGHQINNLGFAHVYYTAEFFFFFLILFQFGTQYKRYWLIPFTLIGIYILVDNFIITATTKFASNSASIQNLFLFIFSAKQIIKITTNNFIPFYKDDRFYIVAGIFVYTGITALLFIIKDFNLIMFIYSISFLIINSMNFFFTYSMVLYYRQRKMLAEALK